MDFESENKQIAAENPEEIVNDTEAGLEKAPKHKIFCMNNLSFIVLCASIIGLFCAILLWALNMSKQSTFVGFLTCLFTCLGFLDIKR